MVKTKRAEIIRTDPLRVTNSGAGLHLTAKGGLYARLSGFKRHLNAVHKKHTAVLKVGGILTQTRSAPCVKRLLR